MTFVQVKDNEWFDLLLGIGTGIVESDQNTSYIVKVCYIKEAGRFTTFAFPTLEEAIAAQKRIVESCRTKYHAELNEDGTIKELRKL